MIAEAARDVTLILAAFERTPFRALSIRTWFPHSKTLNAGINSTPSESKGLVGESWQAWLTHDHTHVSVSRPVSHPLWSQVPMNLKCSENWEQIIKERKEKKTLACALSVIAKTSNKMKNLWNKQRGKTHTACFLHIELIITKNLKSFAAFKCLFSLFYFIGCYLIK